MIMKTFKKIIFVFLFFLSSCGYHFEGGGYLNDDVQQVAIKLFKNNSSETDAAITFTNALSAEVIATTDTKVVNENMADMVIEGQINTIVFTIVSRSSTESVTERRVTAVVDAKLRDKKGEIIWSVKDFSSDETYSVSEDTVTEEASKSQAIDKIAERVAERLVSRMLTDF